MAETGVEAVGEAEKEAKDEAGTEAEVEAGEEAENGAEIKAWRETGPEAVGKAEARARVAAEVETRNKAEGGTLQWDCQWAWPRGAGNYQTFLQIFLLPANAFDAAASLPSSHSSTR